LGLGQNGAGCRYRKGGSEKDASHWGEPLVALAYKLPPVSGQTQLALLAGRIATKLPCFVPLAACTLLETCVQEIIAMQRLGFSFVLFGLTLVLGVVGVMLTDGLAPGRVAPGFAALAAATGGVFLVLGLYALERGRDGARRPG